MHVDREAVRLGVTTAAVPVAASAVRAAALRSRAGFLLTRSWLPGFGLWLDVVLAAPGFLVAASCLAALSAAFALAFREDATTAPVLAGFAVGAATLGGGLGAVSWVGAVVPTVGYARFSVGMALLFLGTASLGALAGDTVGPLFRSPEGSDDEHPRW